MKTEVSPKTWKQQRRKYIKLLREIPEYGIPQQLGNFLTSATPALFGKPMTPAKFRAWKKKQAQRKRFRINVAEALAHLLEAHGYILPMMERANRRSRHAKT